MGGKSTVHLAVRGPMPKADERVRSDPGASPVNGGKARPGLHRREAISFVVAWAGALASGCVPGPTLRVADLPSVERRSHHTNLRVDGRSVRAAVSTLRTGDRDGPRVIYVHGTPGSAEAFVDFLAEPVPDHESISIDRLGFGDSESGRAWPRFEDQVAAIEPLLVPRGDRFPILVGHSLGGPIVARAAAEHPDRVGGLVIVAGSLDPELETPRWFNHVADVPFIRPLVPSVMRTSNDEILAAYPETVALREILARVRCPVVVIHGDRDGLVPVENVAYMQRAFAHVDLTVEVIAGAGHFIPWRHPESIRRAIGSLIDRRD